MKIYFSHTGMNDWKSEIDLPVIGTLNDVINSLNKIDEYVGIKNILISDNRIKSNVRIFLDVSVINTSTTNSYSSFYEDTNTKELTSINYIIPQNADNVLITVFGPRQLIELIQSSMTESRKELFSYNDEIGRSKSKEYKPIISDIDFGYDLKEEVIFGFKAGETTLENLTIGRGNSPKIANSHQGFDKTNSKLLPADLTSAIQDIWDLSSAVGSLRLFQEDSLFFIMSKLMGNSYPKEKQLLLSMPTGGGKTEAFMIPLLSNIYLTKERETKKGIKAVVIYPTNALANDQAMRFVELIYRVNTNLSKQGISVNKHITIGVLSGDTPNKNQKLKDESLIKICPNCGKSNMDEKDGTLFCKEVLKNGDLCNTTLYFCRLTKDEIIDNPPDILITNPDMINFALHSPKYAPIFYNKIQTIVFDEVHIYQGVFGCHIAHLLRRLEEITEHKPLYIGMSATIGNAQELAALLFNEKMEDIKYIKNENNRYTTDKPEKLRYHLLLKPALIRSKKGEDEGQRDKYLRSMTVAGSVGMFIGHLITDSHFRKSIIFTNYRSDADELATYLRERERLDIRVYFDEIISKLKRNAPISDEEVEICQYMHKWFGTIYNAIGSINQRLEVGWNRGGLEKEARIRSVHSFSRNNLLYTKDRDDTYPFDLMVATKTLEVGIDIGDVTTVINSSAPFTTNEYVQRVGRGGRKKDSLAITIINPESAIDAHFKRHFGNYVHAKERDFEDAPIIINNDIIIKKHLLARMLDYFTKRLSKCEGISGNLDIKIGDIVNKLDIVKDGFRVSIGRGVSKNGAAEFARIIFEEIFYKSINNNTVLSDFFAFLKNETTIFGTVMSEIDEEQIRKIFEDTICEINEHIQDKAGSWKEIDFLTGFNAKMSELSPTLRGSGATVSLYVGESKEPADVVSRQTAFNSMPLAYETIASTRSGISTFRIVDRKGENDGVAQERIKDAIFDEENDKVRKYFSTKFDGFPNIRSMRELYTKLDVEVPTGLLVSYLPSRFYCSICKKGLIPNDDTTETKNGVICKRCGNKAQQLHKVYFCECGAIYDPPVPKICINSNCSSYKNYFNQYQENGYKTTRKMYEHFGFRLTKDLEWVCIDCGCKINFSSTQKMRISNSKNQAFVNSVVNVWKVDKTTPAGNAVRLKIYPEELNFSNAANKSHFNCKCDSKKVRTIGVPRVRTISYSYISNKMKSTGKPSEQLSPSISSGVVNVLFNQGYVVQLAEKFLRRYTSGGYGAEVYNLKDESIYENSPSKYLGNYYESHLAWIRFDDILDGFVNNAKYSCDGKCAGCNKFNSLELGELMKPRLTLEEYNYDSQTGMPKKPDHRSRYCKLAMNNECKERVCQPSLGDVCKNYQQEAFLRYLIIHTIKHGIIWALPKYAGVNVSEVKGEIYPNDRENNMDIVLIDSNEGGSGAIILVQKHWNKVWDFAKEVIEATAINDANIILPHTCRRYNADLCPFIASEFLKYIDSLKE